MIILWILASLVVGALIIVTGFLVLSMFGVRISGFRANPRNPVYDRTYLRAMANTGTAMSEQIELEDLMRDRAQVEPHEDT